MKHYFSIFIDKENWECQEGKEMQEKISIIIPVHNAEEYLDECLQSIVNQEYKNIEVILVDDGTSKGSEEIYTGFRQECEGICVVEGQSDGPAKARNRGLDRATGEYIVFIDADDYLPSKDVLSKMKEELERSGADIVVGNYERLWNGTLLPATSNQVFSQYSRESRDFRFMGFFSVGTLSYVWGKMYRTSFIKDNDLKFDDFYYAEDKLLSFKFYIQGAQYTFLEKPVYVYRKNDTSISHGYREDSVSAWMAIAEETWATLWKKGFEKSYGDLVAYTIFFAAFFDGKMNYEYKNKSMKAVKEILKEYASYPLAREKFKELSGGQKNEKISSFLWRFMIGGFALGMRLKCYFLLSLGIKLLIDLKIDERLSDTGKRE